MLPRVVVIGDIMIDETVYGRVDRISPEAPIPVLSKTTTKKTIGGAGNVARNLAHIGPWIKVDMIGWGNPETIMLLSEGLKRPVSLLTPDTLPYSQVNTKLRYVDEKTGYQLIRIDNEHLLKPRPLTFKYVMSQMENQWCEKPQAIVFSDYGKGTIVPEMSLPLIHWAIEHDVPTFVDTRATGNDLLDTYTGATFIVPNLSEFKQIVMTVKGKSLESFKSEEVAAKAVMERIGALGILLKKSEQGMDLILRIGADKYTTAHWPATNKYIVDVTGAGDTVIAAFVSALVSKECEVKSAEIANVLAGDVCMIKGTAIPNRTLVDFGFKPEEMEKLYGDQENQENREVDNTTKAKPTN